MPSRNTVKSYVPGGCYHVYNRGVEKRDIFLDSRDYAVFLHYLKSYLLPPEQSAPNDRPGGIARGPAKFDLHRRVTLLAYCLMPNHFHLMLRQSDMWGMPEFVKRLSNAYVEHFNKRYDRVGSLFQGTYKAVLVNDNPQYLHLTRYIHRNPAELLGSLGLSRLEDYPYSSYPDYLGKCDTAWLRPDEILQLFGSDGRVSPFGPYRAFAEAEDDGDSKHLVGKCLD